MELYKCTAINLRVPDMVSMYNRVRIGEIQAACSMAIEGSSDSKWIQGGNNYHHAHQYIMRHDISYTEILQIVND